MNDTHGVEGKGWFGFDLDGTLAKYDGWKGIDHIGEPVRPMVELIKRMHDEDRIVKIMTARVAPRLCGETHAQGCRCGHCEEEAGKPPVLQEQYLVELDENGISVKRTASDYIREWCQKNLGFVPELVHKKDHLMLELYDDRVKQVVPNEGWLVEDIAMSKRQRTETTITKRSFIDLRWPERVNCFLLGALVSVVVYTITLTALCRNRMPESSKALYDAAVEYKSAYESNTVRDAVLGLME